MILSKFDVALAAAREYYKYNPAGGCLHLVLDDGNVEDDSVQVSLNCAIEDGDQKGIELAELLAKMKPSQRWKLYKTLLDD